MKIPYHRQYIANKIKLDVERRFMFVFESTMSAMSPTTKKPVQNTVSLRHLRRSLYTRLGLEHFDKIDEEHPDAKARIKLDKAR